MSEKLEQLLFAYKDQFGEAFPTIPLLWGENGEENCIMIINDCLRQNKDVYELGYVSEDPDILY